MNYKEFETIIKELFETKEPNVSITPVITRKNNNILYRGLAFRIPGINVAPAVYLDDAYHEYQNGGSISVIYEKLYHTYKSLPLKNTEADLLVDFEKVKDKIVYKLINFEQNKNLLEEIPYVPSLDLAIVFYLLLDITDDCTASILIRNEHLSIWGVDTDMVYSCAQKNTPELLPVSIQSMEDVISAIDTALVTDNINIEMLVLTNTYNQSGAGCILYNGVLKQLGCLLHENFYILPSSTHECLILPKSQAGSGAELKELISEINQTFVDPSEVLSDHPYYYNRQKETLEIAA